MGEAPFFKDTPNLQNLSHLINEKINILWHYRLEIFSHWVQQFRRVTLKQVNLLSNFSQAFIVTLLVCFAWIHLDCKGCDLFIY